MNDFEKQWLHKLRCGLQEVGREDLLDQALKSHAEDVEWSADLMQLLKQELTKEQLVDVMCGCACLAGKDYLTILREEYSQTKDIERVHSMLQEYFEKTIREYKNLSDEEMSYLKSNDMGMAGVLHGNVITAVKIPKEFHEFFKTDDVMKKRYNYCHCPRIREALLTLDSPVDENYCYCGAGFYRNIWEFILQHPVKVRVVESLMQGNELCKIEIMI